MNVLVDVYVDGEFKEVREIELKAFLDMTQQEREETFGYSNEFFWYLDEQKSTREVTE